jgi:hypothetical protein
MMNDELIPLEPMTGFQIEVRLFTISTLNKVYRSEGSSSDVMSQLTLLL